MLHCTSTLQSWVICIVHIPVGKCQQVCRHLTCFDKLQTRQYIYVQCLKVKVSKCQKNTVTNGYGQKKEQWKSSKTESWNTSISTNLKYEETAST